MTCRVRIVAGDAEVRLAHPDHDGRCPLPARARALLAVATASILTQPTVDPPDAERAPIGFTASLERADPIAPNPDWFEDEE